MLLVFLIKNKLLERLTKKNCKNQIKKSLAQKKKLREKVITYVSNGKAIIIQLNMWIDKKGLV